MRPIKRRYDARENGEKLCRTPIHRQGGEVLLALVVIDARALLATICRGRRIRRNHKLTLTMSSDIAAGIQLFLTCV